MPDKCWEQFGLDQAPFEELAQYAMYFPLPEWQKLLDFLKYITRTDKALVVINGVLGSGKTVLAAQYLAQTDPDVESCLLKGSSMLSTKQLFERIAEAFDIKENIADLSVNEQADAIITHLEQRQRYYVLLIDDAHRLPLETLSNIITLAAKQKEANVSLYIVLLGEPQLDERLHNLLEIAEESVAIEQLSLSHLSLAETKSYIKHRLTKSGLTAGCGWICGI